MTNDKVIGGEYEIVATNTKAILSQDVTAYHRYASGRSALYQILFSLKDNIGKVWLPDYLCESVIDAVKRSGIPTDFYPLNDDLRMDVTRFVAQRRATPKKEAVIIINYFGIIDLCDTIAELRKCDQFVVIEDDVQALFSFIGNNTPVDYRFTSLRKTIAVPDGGLVFTRNSMPRVYAENTFAPLKYRAACMKYDREKCDSDRVYLDLFEEGERLIDDNWDSVMSEESAALYQKCVLSEVRQKRIENAQYIVSELEKLGMSSVVPIKEGMTPLFVPIILNNRDCVRKALFAHQIFCPVHWPIRSDMKQLSTGVKMSEQELSIIVDQRYGISDMQRIVDVIKMAVYGD